MKMTLHTVARVLVANLLLCDGSTLQAGETWDGGAFNNNWSSNNNWSPNGAPANNGTADIVMDGNTRLSPNLNANWNIDTLTFASSAGNFTIGGSSTLTIQNGITNNDSGTQTLNVDVVVAGSQTWAANAGTLVIGSTGANRTVSSNSTVTLSGAGNILINSQFTGSGSLIKNGSGTATLSYGGNSDSSLSTYSGTTTVNEGLLISDLGATDGVPTTPLTGAITIGGGSSSAELRTQWQDQIGNSTSVTVLDQGTLSVDGSVYGLGAGYQETIGSLVVSGGALVRTVGTGTALVLNGNVTHDGVGTAPAVIQGNLSLGAATRTFDIGDSSSAIDLDVTAVVSSGSLTKTGDGVMVLSATNTYTGATTVSDGVLAVNGSTNSGSTVTVTSGGTLSGEGTIGGNVVVQSGGTYTPGNGQTGDAGVETIGGNLTMQAGSVFSWDLNANSTARGSAYDGVDVTGNVILASGSSLDVNLAGSGSSVDFTDTFWASAQQWQVIMGGASLTGSLTLGGISLDSLGQNHASYGSFSITTSGGDLYLNWAPLPELGNLSIGILLAAGAWRRRR